MLACFQSYQKERFHKTSRCVFTSAQLFTLDFFRVIAFIGNKKKPHSKLAVTNNKLLSNAKQGGEKIYCIISIW